MSFVEEAYISPPDDVRFFFSYGVNYYSHDHIKNKIVPDIISPSSNTRGVIGFM